MTELAPIVLFVYKRPDHVRKVLESLSINPQVAHSKLYIFSDGARTVEEQKAVDATRALVHGYSWPGTREIIEQPINVGLARSIVDGINYVLSLHDRIIVLEDDVMVAPHFLHYMNDALVLYAEEPRVMHVAAFMFPLSKQLPETFFYNANSCWGWGTWRRAWHHYNNDAIHLLEQLRQRIGVNYYDFNKGQGNAFLNQLIANTEGRLLTWAVKWHTSIYLQGGFCLHPRRSLVNNIGFDGTGTHCGSLAWNFNSLTNERILVTRQSLTESADALEAVATFYQKMRKQQPIRRSVWTFLASAIGKVTQVIS